jgi:poly(A)-specific ribonuclease
MNVTKANFEEAFKQLQELLPTAEFVAFDEEMTGITLPGQPERIGDVPAQRYAKMRNVAMKYNIIQFGVCLFHAKEGGDGYVARPYNFYTFPEAGAINMEGSSIGFLRGHDMDFNKWIYEGIPYVNRASADKLRSSLLSTDKADKGDEKRTPLVLTKPSDIQSTNEAIEGLKSWLADDSKKEETEYAVMTTNPYIRRFLYETVAAQFPDLLAESRAAPGAFRGQSTFFVLRLNESQRAEHEAKVREEKQKQFDQKVGFFRIFDLLVNAKKPLIGHNCMYDNLFMMSHFEGPLPASYSSFKELFHTCFPLLFDTKACVAREPFKYVPETAATSAPTEGSDPSDKRVARFGSTALGEVYKVFLGEAKAAKDAGTSSIEVSFAPNFDRYEGEGNAAAHEAAYDAYMTGFAFAHMAKHALAPENVATYGSLTPMFRALFDFNLAGEDKRLYEGIYVHVAGLKGRSADDLCGAFAEIKAPVQIRWIDDDSAFAVLPEACAEEVSALVGRASPIDGLTLTLGNEWFASQTAKAEASENGSTGDAEPSAKRARTNDA